MNLTDREKLLLLIFPAVLVFAVYAWAFGTASQNRMVRVQDELAAMRQDAAGAATAQQIWQQRSRLKELRRAIDEAQARSASLRREADELGGSLAARRRDIETIDALTALLRRHRILIEEELPARGADTAGMAASLEQATRTLQESLSAPQTTARARTGRARATVSIVARPPASAASQDTRFRRLRFQGRFADVLAALEELAETDGGAVAVSLEMEEIGPARMFSDVRRWTLWIRV
jgi:DNA repair exonuclease SbcCD ATPase subunit